MKYTISVLFVLLKMSHVVEILLIYSLDSQMFKLKARDQTIVDNQLTLPKAHAPIPAVITFYT